MKKIEFIAPVEAMRGNLSGNQDLKYPTDNNKAFESPEGSVNYARNYTSRFIGAKRASDGMKYFSVKTKSATHITPRSLMAMALLGAAGAMYAALVRDKTSSIYNNIHAQWIELQNLGSTKTFRRYVMDNFRQALATKAAVITFAGPRGSITVNNPWVSEDQTVGVAVSPAILVKFWPQLTLNGYTFTINDVKVVGKPSYDFGNLLELPANSTTGLTSNDQDYILLGNSYVLTPGGEYVMIGSDPEPNAKYTTTDIAPA